MKLKGGVNGIGYNTISNNILFKDFEQNILSEIASNFVEEIWPAHTCSNCENLKHKFHIIISGRLKVFQTDKETGREFTLFLLTKNDFFDVISLVDGCNHKIYYESLEEVKMLSTATFTMRKWLKTYPKLNERLLSYIGKQLLRVEDYAVNHTFFEIPARLARLILENLNHKSQKLEYINDLSNEEIANLIGSTRAVVNRHFQDFKKEGILKISRKKMEVINLPLLLKKATNE
ncbi:CRP/FNR family transcriptional regulator, anaerobic regulatory protein [Salegentibacter holothuriorum]|uniref:CRP/FNR family transcriptional regulator, anaerobic regulatory protein n=1 Tax=Salegentibacter holothuriorum TaxID=241145 RepID=A0A1T5AAZ2_9FLAO|nr:Crp/Fnr family transcriptional regulator [Salegentibacter holothuriorum]SKB32075.1 CRP/FNR family transcriptional regulator, anaerobic regulatory protein [Salegentibacter holothuriorum]